MRRKADGTLHFYVNSIDQGAAATNVPNMVYGVIDLYGQAAEATIVDHTGELCIDHPGGRGGASNVTDNMMYGVIDLYGQAADATIVDHTGRDSREKEIVNGSLVL